MELFDALTERIRAEEINRLREEEMELMTTYEGYLKKMMDLFRVDEVSEWCNRLNGILGTLAKAAADQAQIEDGFKPLLDQDLGSAEIKEMSDRVEELIEGNAKLTEQEAVLTGEIADLEEELFQIVQELDGFKEWGGQSQDKEISALWEGRIRCKVCGNNKRDCVLSTCMHAMCRACADHSGNVCPMCGVKFGDDCVRPLIFQ
jgi:hypothetical protein